MNISSEYKIENCVSDDKTRASIGYIKVEKGENGKGVAIATDGHKLVAVPVNEVEKDCLIAPDTLIAARKAMGKRASAANMEITDSGVRLINGVTMPHPNLG